MERRHIPEPETRLTILYALRALGPVTGMQLLQFMVELDLMNYFTMQLSLCELEEQQQVHSQAHPAGDLMEITEAGAFALESFAHRIPASRRRLMDERAPLWRGRFRGEQQAPADSFTLQDGRVCLRLRLMEGRASLLDILLTLPAEASLTFLQKRWHAAAPRVYESVTLTLAEGFSPDVPAPLPAPNAAVQQAGAQEWLVSLADAAEHPTLTLLFTLPDEALARHCAAAWPRHCEALRALILQALRDGLSEESPC